MGVAELTESRIDELVSVLNTSVDGRADAAFGELHDLWMPRALGLARFFCSDETQVDDVLQQSFLTLWTAARAGGVRPSTQGGRPWGWFASVVANEAKRVWCRERREEEKLERYGKELRSAVEHGLDPEEAYFYAQSLAQRSDFVTVLKQVIQELDSRDRDLLVRRFYGRQSYSQIAAETGAVSEVALRKEVQRLKGRMRRLLEERLASFDE